MSRTYEFYRGEKDYNDAMEDQRHHDEEERYYHEQMELMKETDDLSEIPSTEEDLFRQILEDERNESE